MVYFVRGENKMNKKFINDIVLENASIWRKNFRGAEEEYNEAGNRYFLVNIPADLSEQLISDGWNVKVLAPRNEDEDTRIFLKVSVKFGKIPPKVMVVDETTKQVKNILNEETIGSLDHVKFKNVDLIIRPYVWEVGNKTGVKAYLKTMYVTLAPNDPLEAKYKDISDTNELTVNSDPLPF